VVTFIVVAFTMCWYVETETDVVYHYQSFRSRSWRFKDVETWRFGMHCLIYTKIRIVVIDVKYINKM